jgi:hypothetical protein
MLSFFEKLFSSKNKENGKTNHTKNIPLSTQIEVLKDVGLSLMDGLGTQFLLYEFDKSVYEKDPFGYLMFVYGSEHEENGVWKRNSDDIFSFDTECIEDNGSYTRVLEHLKDIAKGCFDICNIQDNIDYDGKLSWVSFEYEGKMYKWDLIFDDDWFYVGLIEKINELLNETARRKRFYSYSPDQTLTVVFLDNDKVKVLNKVTGLIFK